MDSIETTQQESVLVLSSCASFEEARNMAEALVTEGLVACCSLLPGMLSVYRWDSAVQQSSEVLCLMKTRQNLIDALERRFHELHRYEVPEFLVLPIRHSSNPYAAWMNSVLAAPEVER